MKVFIFGAGASKASQNPPRTGADSLASPLVNELFDAKYERYAKQIGLALTDLNDFRNSMSGEESLEQWLTSRWEEINKIPDAGLQHAEKSTFGRLTFYIWRLLQEVSATYDDNNGYRRFLKIMRDRREYPGFISFNYDTLLDRAVKQIYGANLIGSLESYSQARLIKPHGSVNWLLGKRTADATPNVELSYEDNIRYDLASNAMFNGSPLDTNNIQVFDPAHNDLNNLSLIHSNAFSGFYFYPLVLIPLTTKLYPFFTGFQEKVVNEGKKLIADADEIYLIGYRAADDIIRDMLNSLNFQRKTKLHVVAHTNAASIMSKVLSLSLNLEKGTEFNGGFHEFINYYQQQPVVIQK